MNKLYLTSCLLAIFALPAFADIDKSASTATCDSATIGATSGNAYMDTDWTANTINLQWYSNGEQIDVSGTDSATCTYDDTITLPSTPTVPTGYTFGGWKVRVAAAGFDLSTLDTSINGGTRYYVSRNFNTGAAECQHNASGSWATVSCDDPLVSDLEMSEWKVDFSYGTVKGIGRCSKVSGDWAQTGDPTDDWMQSGAKYCWCQATNYTPLNGTEQSVASSSWVFYADNGDAVYCAYNCANNCSNNVNDRDDFRRAVFGIAQ